MITEIYIRNLDSSCRELFIRGLGFIAVLLVRWQIIFLSGHQREVDGHDQKNHGQDRHAR